jgi:hypothetical protein
VKIYEDDSMNSSSCSCSSLVLDFAEFELSRTRTKDEEEKKANREGEVSTHSTEDREGSKDQRSSLLLGMIRSSAHES